MYFTVICVGTLFITQKQDVGMTLAKKASKPSSFVSVNKIRRLSFAQLANSFHFIYLLNTARHRSLKQINKKRIESCTVQESKGNNKYK